MTIQTAYIYEGQSVPPEVLAEIEAAEEMPINLDDIPEITDEEIAHIGKTTKECVANSLSVA